VDDTIVALATSLGEASIHVLRISGPHVEDIINTCFLPKNKERWDSHENYTLYLGKFYDGDKIIDEVLVSRMLAPHSFTGEDVIEVSCHGGLFVAQKVLETFLKNGARLAEAGEFTKRAFLNGKLDLVQAEAIIDLISAKNEGSADLALSQLGGELSAKILDLRENILETLAFIEAGIDFPEDDVEELDREALSVRLERGIQQAEELLNGSKTGKILREGLLTVIVGQPNVGKSSLLNALMKEERAIVTDIPGTTRDEIREAVNIGGILLQLVDTAGIRMSEDPVEKMGIERTWKAVEKAELILLIIEAGKELSAEEQKILEHYSERVIVLMNKVELLDISPSITSFKNEVWIPFSVQKEIGFDFLVEEVRRRVYQGFSEQSKEPLLSNVRQINALRQGLEELKNALTSLKTGVPWDILSIDVREGLENISEITGQNVQESLLEDIFTRFCIGK
jgi:tRNA modification GTPase